MRINGKRSGLLSRFFIRVIFGAIIGCVACGCLWFVWKKVSDVTIAKKHMLVEQELQYCGELVTVKSRFSDVISIKKSAVLGMAKSYSIVRYTGMIRAGIADITQSAVSVSDGGKAVRVVLPHAEVLGNDIIAEELFDEHQNIFVPITTQEIFNEVDASRTDAQDKLIAEGLLSEADTYACHIVRAVLTAAGFTDITVTVKK